MLHTSVFVSGGLYASRGTGIMGQRGTMCLWYQQLEQGRVYTLVITSKYQVRLASKLNKSLGNHVWAKTDNGEMRGSASWPLTGPGGPSHLPERLLGQLRNPFAYVHAHMRQLETKRSKTRVDKSV